MKAKWFSSLFSSNQYVALLYLCWCSDRHSNEIPRGNKSKWVISTPRHEPRNKNKMLLPSSPPIPNSSCAFWMDFLPFFSFGSIILISHFQFLDFHCTPQCPQEKSKSCAQSKTSIFKFWSSCILIPLIHASWSVCNSRYYKSRVCCYKVTKSFFITKKGSGISMWERRGGFSALLLLIFSTS